CTRSRAVMAVQHTQGSTAGRGRCMTARESEMMKCRTVRCAGADQRKGFRRVTSGISAGPEQGEGFQLWSPQEGKYDSHVAVQQVEVQQVQVAAQAVHVR